MPSGRESGPSCRVGYAFEAEGLLAFLGTAAWLVECREVATVALVPPMKLKSVDGVAEDLGERGDAVRAEDSAGGNVIGGKLLRLRWAARCIDCDRSLAPGEQAWWFHLEDVGRCLSCAEPAVPGAPEDVDSRRSDRSALSRRQKTAASPTSVPTEQPGLVQAAAAKTQKSGRVAGGSAQAEYERRRDKDRARRYRSLPLLLPVVLAAPFVGYFATRVGAVILDHFLGSIGSSAVDGGVETDPMFDPGMVHLVGLVAALAMTILALSSAFAARQSTEAWRIGAEGERLTARALKNLPSQYRVLHDLPMPRSKANIDHVVVGPTGVFTVETKNYKNGVTIKRGRAYSAGRSLDGVVRQAQRQASAVADVTGNIVTRSCAFTARVF